VSWVWVGWLVFLAASFAAFEGYALTHGKTTLSRFTWNISKAFPLFPWLVGVLVGVLACHMWWGGIVCFAPVK